MSINNNNDDDDDDNNNNNNNNNNIGLSNIGSANHIILRLFERFAYNQLYQ